jgi:ribA/ribD-fused uncharacterized protein
MLPLDLQTLRASSDAFIFRQFYGHRPQPDGRLGDSCFSQWWPCRFVLDDVPYVTAEQFMMAGKARLFGDRDALEKILAEANESKVKALGRQVRGFDEVLWAKHRFELVAFGSHAKFSQDAALEAHLRSTGDAILVEASSRDRLWGIGLGRQNPLINEPTFQCSRTATFTDSRQATQA